MQHMQQQCCLVVCWGAALFPIIQRETRVFDCCGRRTRSCCGCAALAQLQCLLSVIFYLPLTPAHALWSSELVKLSLAAFRAGPPSGGPRERRVDVLPPHLQRTPMSEEEMEAVMVWSLGMRCVGGWLSEMRQLLTLCCFVVCDTSPCDVQNSRACGSPANRRATL
eukprot:m.125152 g.125152  ORF g.125152 m.125152 type:complete len:166 (+) comp9685_c0_seq12:252-749(+)